ncbi:small oligopeptide transporter-2 [Coleophoma cylindrospora]|uniref:Small oligopeptide transporter-2 n=1 Tax=Coleophoma cylindrospora TaxID=1849047 RepID=A0A3D8QNN5_9HELO|nr:small oligopeptide transporter-2 [Coleophoma cylindrospora]
MDSAVHSVPLTASVGEDVKGPADVSIDDNASIAIGEELAAFKRNHAWDPNLPEERRRMVEMALKDKVAAGDAALDLATTEQVSVYPEVRAAVKNYDEDVPASTIRAWTIALFLTTVGAGINQLFAQRAPSIGIHTYAIQLIAYPLGVGWTKIMPTRKFNTFGVEWTLNPGPFNAKEHTIIVAMANASYGSTLAYSVFVIMVQRIWYHKTASWGYQILLSLTSQCIGFCFAGLVREFLVWPSTMLWPSTLAHCALFNTLHDHAGSDPQRTNGWSIGRYRYFLYVFIGAFVWYWFPGWIAQFLSFFVFPTWIAPHNKVVNQLFGGSSGLGLLPITFDWTIISGYISSPLISPWHAIANTLIGLVIIMVISGLATHYSGTWYTDYLPFISNSGYDNTGKVYNVTRILNADLTFNETAYKEYSPIFVSTGQALSYGASFASLSAVIVYIGLYHGPELWARFRNRSKETDIHSKFMEKYKEVPSWWYASLAVLLLALSFVTVLVWDTGMKWYSLVIAMALVVVFFIPAGIIQATTNTSIGLNVIAELIIGYIQPGHPIAMLLFKTYAYISLFQGLSFSADLKMGHYMKVPPRVMFSAQLAGTVWSSFVELGVLNWMFANIPNLCSSTQKDHFTCPGATSYYTNSVFFGVIGPQRMFTKETYGNLLWFFLLGAGLTVVTYFAARRWPQSNLRYIMTPVIFGGIGAIPPATVYTYGCWAIVGFIFNKYIKTRWSGWWLEYNYITSAALDSGLLISTIVIFFVLRLPGATAPKWWGNDAVFKTLDMTAAAKKIPENGKFGPTSW